MLGLRDPASSNSPVFTSEGHQMLRAARKRNAPDHDEQQQRHAASPHHADATSQPGTGMLGRPGQADGKPYADQAVATCPASPDAPSQQGGSQLSDICLPSSSFDLPRFDVGQAGQGEGETCWPIPAVTQAPHPTLPLPPRAGSLPPRRSNESNASSGHENLLRGDSHGATSRHNHETSSEYPQRAASMHARNFTPGYLLTQDQPHPQGLPYIPSPMPCQPFNGLGAMTGDGPERGMHHSAATDTGDEHWPAQKPTLPWDRQERLGASDTAPTADDIDYVQQMLEDVYEPNAMNWPHSQYILGDSSQHLGYLGVSNDAPGGTGTLAQHTMSGSSAGLSHASVMPPNLPVGAAPALPALALGGGSPCSLEAGNTTPTTMLPANDAMYLTGMYDVMAASPNQGAAGGMHDVLGCGVVRCAGPLDDATGSGGGGSGVTLIGMQAGCNSMDASKTSVTRLQALSQINPSPSSPISAAPHPPPATKSTPTSSQPSAKRSRRDAEPPLPIKAEATAAAALGTRRACGTVEESSGLSPAKKATPASSNPAPSATPPPSANKALPGTPNSGPGNSKPPASAFRVPNLKLEGGTEGSSKRSKQGATANIAAQIVGPTGLGKSAASTLLATLPKPADAIQPILNASAKGRDSLVKGDTKALLDLLTPTHMDLAPRKPRRGGGRTSQADPRLMDPDMDDKKARRIVANRLSAARSKMRQRHLAEQVEQEHMALEQHKARLAMTISELTQKVNGLEAENGTLKQRITQLETERNKAMAQATRIPTAMPAGNDANLAGQQQQQRPVSKFSIGGAQTAALGLGGLAGRWHHSNLPGSSNIGNAQPATGPQSVFPASNMAESMPSMTTLAGGAAQQATTPRLGGTPSLPPGLLSNMGSMSRQPSLLPNHPTVLRSGSGLAMDTTRPMYPEAAYPDGPMPGGRHGLKLQATNLPCPPTTMPALNLQEGSYPAVPPLGAPGQQPTSQSLHGLMLGPESAHMSEWVPGMPPGHHRMPPGSAPRGYPAPPPLLHQQGWGMKGGSALGMDRPCALALDDSLVHMSGGVTLGSTHQHSASNSNSMTQGGLSGHDGAIAPGMAMM